MATSRASKKTEKTLTQEMSVLLAKTFLPDLTDRARQPAVEEALRQRWQAERDGRRTAADFDEWVSATVEQVGAAWILSCVFVRVLEDRGFLDRRRIAGEGADDSLQQFMEIAPALTERDYLLTVFRELATYPGAADVLDPAHNPAWHLSPSNDSVRRLLTLLRETNSEGVLRFRFGREDTRDTRFLGDLYQDVSESVRKRYALLQTPDFIEQFILDQTLEPAIRDFSLESVRLIDPTCGSGHFLLGAFHRLFEQRQRKAPGIDRREHAKGALAQVFGVDINPYAVAIARFRLTLVYLEHAGIDKLALAPRVETNVVVADSLLHGGPQVRFADREQDEAWIERQIFALNDPEEARRLFGQRYHAVVGNPPYITCKDPVLREQYRHAYESAAGKYALAAPFTERFFQLAEPGGYVGMINANSFMKREFGKALIERALPRVELTEVIDTSGAHIPGHGRTPTVLLFGRNRTPVTDRVRVVMGKRGDPVSPEQPEQGHVWSSIAGHHAQVAFENDYISVSEIPRETLAKHPWSLGGGGAAELKELLEERCEKRLGEISDEIGFASFPGLDDLFLQPAGVLKRWGIDDRLIRPAVIGEDIRDWAMAPPAEALAPYDLQTHAALPLEKGSAWYRAIWPLRTTVNSTISFGGKTRGALGDDWWLWYRWQSERYQAPYRITFAEVATHNHFFLDRGGSVFKQTAPIIKLPSTAGEDEHLRLLAYLNSSTGCFWMKQVAHPKGSASGDLNKEKGKPEDNRFAFSGTALANMPIPALSSNLADLTREMERLASRRAACEPLPTLRRAAGKSADPQQALATSQQEAEDVLARMVAVQEDIDWAVYALVGLAKGEAAGRWTPSATLDKDERPFACESAPQSFGSSDAELWRARKDAIAAEPELQLIETPVNKRRWRGARGVFATKAANYPERAVDAARVMLAEWAEEQLRNERAPLRMREIEARVPERVRQLCRIVAGDDVNAALVQSISPLSVPFLAALTYSPDGLAKRAAWERTWEQQRAEDRGHQSSAIVAPPKYTPDNYQEFSYWSSRGKLDVTKERFISYLGLEHDDDKSPLVGWAGWNYLQRAQALATLFQERKDQDGWSKDRLVPILAGLLELIPWLKQWNNDPDPAYDGQRMGDIYEAFTSEKSRSLGVTSDELLAWRPVVARNGKRKPNVTRLVATKTDPADSEIEPAEETVTP